MADNFDVVVIGYGPVGQMLSTQLAQAGHSVAAFERHAQFYGLSRAGHVDDEIMRTLQKVGAGEEFREDDVDLDRLRAQASESCDRLSATPVADS